MKCNTKPREIHTVVDLLQSNNSLWRQRLLCILVEKKSFGGDGTGLGRWHCSMRVRIHDVREVETTNGPASKTRRDG